MKIDNSAKTVGPAASPATSRAPATRATATSAATPVAAAAQSSTVLSGSMQSVSGTDGAFDAKKVAEIRLAISEGRFQINSERIADGLISSVREMLGQGRRANR
jgi:negative regulator of flagellin synthesis FlgM